MELFYFPLFKPGMKEIELSAEESYHARRVLRKQMDEVIEITDGNGHHIQGIVTHVSRSHLTVRIRSYQKYSFDPANAIEIGLALIRPNRFSWAVEKLTELGVRKIVPLICHHSVIRDINLNHLLKVAVSAMKQSHQFYLPEISPVISFMSWMEACHNRPALRFLAHLPLEEQEFSSRAGNMASEVILGVGPEGGFHQTEIENALNFGFDFIKLNNTVLRSETAAIVAVAQLKLGLLRKNMSP
ncbi:MAG: 16S rRNA (uracil(1498)-N(3))-methyltransferase [Calditrichia bacterium]